MRSEQEIKNRIRQLWKDRSAKMRELEVKFPDSQQVSRHDLMEKAAFLRDEIFPLDESLTELFWALGLIDDTENGSFEIPDWVKE